MTTGEGIAVAGVCLMVGIVCWATHSDSPLLLLVLILFLL